MFGKITVGRKLFDEEKSAEFISAITSPKNIWKFWNFGI